MLTRISLIVAIIAGLAVAGLNFVKVKEKITTLQANLAEQTQGREKAEKELASTQSELKKTAAKLKKTETELADANTAKDTAEKNADTQSKRADKLKDDLDKRTKERDDAQAELAAYRATDLKPEQIVEINKKFKGLNEELAGAQEENKVLGRKITKLENELAIYKTPEYHVPLPAGLRGKVMVTDPKWNFVVLNVGDDQGVLEQGELLVNRDGKLVAKVKVRTVQKDRSVANVMPGWQLGDIIEGDQVIPAYPSSS